MTDEIAGGGDGRPRWHLSAALVLAAAVVFGYVLSHQHPPARPRAEPGVGVPARQSISPAPRAQLSGSVRAGPPGLRLLVDGTDPRIIDAHTLAVTPVPGLRLRRGQVAQVLQFGSANLAALAPLYGPNGGIYLVRPGKQALLLGANGAFLPSRDGGLLVATYGPGVTTVTGLALDRRVRSQWSLPGDIDPLRDTPAGLVVAQYPHALTGDAELLLLDRQTGAVRRRLAHDGYPVATDDRSIAWVPNGCEPYCPLIRTELTTGTARRYRMPDRREPAAGAFAPDGQRLALSFSGVPGEPGLLADPGAPARPGFAAVLDLRTSALTTVPGLATPPGEHADLIWSTDGHWLVLGVKRPDEELIAVWRPDSELIILPLTLPGEPSTATLAALR